EGAGRRASARQVLTGFVEGGGAYRRRVLTLGDPIDPDLAAQHLKAEFEAILDKGLDRWIKTGGGGSTSDGGGSTADGEPPYSLTGPILAGGPHAPPRPAP